MTFFKVFCSIIYLLMVIFLFFVEFCVPRADGKKLKKIEKLQTILCILLFPIVLLFLCVYLFIEQFIQNISNKKSSNI